MRRAFTLIELLVVAAVVAVLLAILLPALAGVREEARTIVCKANLAQIDRAISAYVSENDSWPIGWWEVDIEQPRCPSRQDQVNAYFIWPFSEAYRDLRAGLEWHERRARQRLRVVFDGAVPPIAIADDFRSFPHRNVLYTDHSISTTVRR